MGHNSGVVTVRAILASFDSKARWRQAELARKVGVTVPSLRKHLAELDGFLPLTATKDGNDIFWELASGWDANGLRLPLDSTAKIVRLLVRAPKSRLRDEMLAALVRKAKSLGPTSRVSSGELGAVEDIVSMLEDAAARATVLRLTYLSSSLQTRDLSVLRVLHGPSVRFVAYCHLRRGLRWFRADRVQFPIFAPETRFENVDDARVDAFIARAVDGFSDDGEGECTFVVRHPESRWVRANLHLGMRAEEMPGGAVRVVAPTAGLLPTARFCVGLGDAATPETAELADAVRALAKGALAAAAVSPVRPKTLRPRSAS